MMVSGAFSMAGEASLGRRRAGVYTYLTMTAGQQVGATFVLDPRRDNLLGRGAECDVVLADALCSRVHAILRQEAGLWKVRDNDSRNGAFVDGRKIAEAVLVDGSVLRMGGAEFAFHQSEQPPTATGRIENDLDKALVAKESLTGPTPPPESLADESEAVHELSQLFRLATQLLECVDPRRAVLAAAELLRERTQCTVATYWRAGQDGLLHPALLVPENARAPAAIDGALARLICQEGQAVWISDRHRSPREEAADSQGRRGDSLCVPLWHEGRALGVLHAWLAEGRFRRSQFDFAVALARLTATGLARMIADSRRVAGLELAEVNGETVETLRIDHWERRLIVEALRRVKGNVPEAARLLGIGRATLYRKLDEFRIGKKGEDG